MWSIFLNLLSSLSEGVSYADSYLPRQASTIAADVDMVYNYLYYVSVFFFVLIMSGLAVFIVKYRRKTDHDKTAYITHNHALEFLWSFIPLVLLLVAFFWGWKVYKDARTFPVGAYEIDVRGKQWQWDFIYYDNSGENGTRREVKKTTAQFVVPAKTPVILNMTSSDVIHSFYIPSFRVKQDVVPGKISRLWFQADEPGEFQVFCTEFCGTAHSQMLAKVTVVPKSQFDAWLQKKSGDGMSLAELGKELHTSKGCIACHSVDGTAKVGPSWKGIWGQPVAWVDGGQLKERDENYIRESILNPQAHIVKGYEAAGIMPSYQGQVTEDELKQIIEFIKSLK